MSKEKKAFIFDTNFILQNIKLNEVVNRLKDDYEVYVTQVSIDERISQQCRDVKKEYDEMELKKTLWGNYATIIQKYSFDVYSSSLRKGVQKIYEELFSDRIIPYSVSEETFKTVLNRAYMKMPPFKEEGTDGGLKDTLMWLSIIDYFKKDGEKEVLFLTNDRGFLKQTEALTEEFKKHTGKSIQIENNDYYKIMGQPQKEDKVETAPINYKEIREKISKVLYKICWTTAYDREWGEYETKTFVVRKKVDNQYIKTVFDNLKDFTEKHIFTSKVKASDFLELDNRVEEDNYQIMMEDVDALEELYEMLLQKFPDYAEQFYTAVAEIINENFEYRKNYINDADLPF